MSSNYLYNIRPLKHLACASQVGSIMPLSYQLYVVKGRRSDRLSIS